MDPEQLRKVMREVCWHRKPLGHAAARSIVRAARAEGRRLWHYRCPFSDPAARHWHVAPPKSKLWLQRMALAMRARAGVL